jgi:hypothetical protein
MESFEDFVEDVANGDHGDRPKAEENDAGSKGNLFLAERRLKVEIEWDRVAMSGRWFPARKYLIDFDSM